VRKLVQDGTIQSTHIPMAEGIESLNAGISGSVILFDFARQINNISKS
jgi:tRNA G18 (ribose-2'-O)-methylase SpoU